MLVLGEADLMSVLPQAMWADPPALLPFGLCPAPAAGLWVAGLRWDLLPFLAALRGVSGSILFTLPRIC